ncbi:ABC transporter ATP-binding protein [Nocardioides sp. Root190]|uniref:ABC transporter ATP-binding protein n=1 Tax=Nocardioides sp. Root190 TaxID=1736488 RepID=UPI0006FEB666|nr:ABC transporter ATP-binding protein [Nocardioides sp. Root190]KRB76360.1 ABC transporter ATP-binding protein [Nocardioides sp. Root190]
MADVTISALSKRFGGSDSEAVIDDLDLHIQEGELLVLLGASGCGKTTTLRCLAGLESPSEGTISFGDRVVYDASRRVDVPAEKRNVGMVFQSYALWPHMTVRKNIGYPLKVRRNKEGLRDGWVEKAAAMVDCSHLLDRYPGQLSGGQQQRVALARGIVSRPDLMLFDEPLSNLDAQLRELVRTELHALHRQMGFTAVFVTHDQDEALALGDRMAILRGGRVEQCAAPRTVFEDPASDYVAEFIGMADTVRLTRSDTVWSHAGGTTATLDIPRGHDAVDVRIRPDDVQVRAGGAPARPGELVVEAVVTDVVYGGRHVDATMTVEGGSPLRARVPVGAAEAVVAPGERVGVAFPADKVRVFDGVTGQAVARTEQPARVSA